MAASKENNKINEIFAAASKILRICTFFIDLYDPIAKSHFVVTKYVDKCISHCHEKCGEGFALCLQCYTRNKLPCYSQFLTQRLNLRPTNPKHFYLELEANIGINFSLRKPFAVSLYVFIFKSVDFSLQYQSCYKKCTFLGNFTLSFQSVIFQLEWSASLVFIEFPSISHQKVFLFSCIKL